MVSHFSVSAHSFFELGKILILHGAFLEHCWRGLGEKGVGTQEDVVLETTNGFQWALSKSTKNGLTCHSG